MSYGTSNGGSASSGGRGPEGGETLLENLISHLAGLPSIGRKTAQRLAYHLLAQDADAVNGLSRALSEAKARIHPCSQCGNYTERDLCAICAGTRRNQALICVVEKPSDILAFERSGSFQGVYHVLGGSLSPLDGVGPKELNLARLWERSENASGGVELILALSTDAEGEATATYIAQRLQGRAVKISRLARGIPVGSELDYVDELTMQRALEGRTTIA